MKNEEAELKKYEFETRSTSRLIAFPSSSLPSEFYCFKKSQMLNGVFQKEYRAVDLDIYRRNQSIVMEKLQHQNQFESFTKLSSISGSSRTQRLEQYQQILLQYPHKVEF